VSRTILGAGESCRQMNQVKPFPEEETSWSWFEKIVRMTQTALSRAYIFHVHGGQLQRDHSQQYHSHAVRTTVGLLRCSDEQ